MQAPRRMAACTLAPILRGAAIDGAHLRHDDLTPLRRISSMASIHKDISHRRPPRRRLGRGARFRRRAHAAGAGLRHRHAARRRRADRHLRQRQRWRASCWSIATTHGGGWSMRSCNERVKPLQRLGAGARRWRDAQPADLDRRCAAQRDRALYRRPDGSGALAMQKALRTRHDALRRSIPRRA